MPKVESSMMRILVLVTNASTDTTVSAAVSFAHLVELDLPVAHDP
jgi:hypothetical protein